MQKTLKKNDFKTVTLHTGGERWFVEKSFTAFSIEQQHINTQYLYDALTWFYQSFHTVIDVPAPVRIDLKNSSVYMEYLDDLPNASYISSRSINRARDFFEHCYDTRSDQGFLRNMQGSVAVTPLIQALLDSDFPQSLGFKGDLRENLVVGSQNLILADIDSIALEPLGLSELALYAELACSFSPRRMFTGLFFSLPTPVAYRHLDVEQAHRLNEAAVELITINMGKLSPRSKSFKVRRALSILTRLVRNNYTTELM